ncbi:hypothetical protein AB0O28_28855 [Microbispora sp. NPDC088329]|uniref:hypothetical protein n=1 Tax=Microbispora sp. NPDC088329 TaxID=3154869 RepID=UPI0034174B63
MKRSRVMLAGVLALGLAGTITAAANAKGTEPATFTVTTGTCPGQDANVGTVRVEAGKVYLDGKSVGSVPSDGKLKVPVKDGEISVGTTEALSQSPHAATGGQVTRDTGDDKGETEACAVEKGSSKK